MELSRKYFCCLFLLVFLVSKKTEAQQNSEEAYLLNTTRINAAIDAIRDKKLQAPSDFFSLLQKNLNAINDSTIAIEHRVEFQQRLAFFLESTKEPEFFKNGKYTSLLRYNLFLIQWKNSKELYANVLQYPRLSIKALRLFAMDTAAYRFLDSMATRYPDEILRNSESFVSLWYAPKIIAKIALVAPESAKRYFAGSSKIKDILLNDTTAIFQTLRTINAKLPARTKAYFLVDPIVKKSISVFRADTLMSIKENAFSALVDVMKKPNPIGLYSLNRELDYIAVDVARGLSLKSDAAIVNYYQITEYSKEEIIAVLIYGYKEMYPIDFSNMLSILLRKGEVPVEQSYFENFPTSRMAEFVRFLQQEDKLESFIRIVGEPNSLFLKELLSYEKPLDDLTPDLINTDIIEKEEPVSFQQRRREEVAPIKKEDVQLSLAKIEDKIKVEQKVEELKPSLEPAEEIIEPVYFDFTDEQKLKLIYKKNIYASLQNIDAFINEPFAKEILLYAAEIEPDEVFKRAEKFKSKYFMQEVLEKAALQAPVSAKKYLVNPYHLVTFFLAKSENPFIRKMIEINMATGFKSKPYLLINQLTSNEMSIETALAICNNQDRLFKELVKLVAKKNYVGRNSIEKEFSYYALRFIRDINDKVAQPDNIRFAALDNLSKDELYCATVYGREEVFNSTFLGIFARFESSLQPMDDIAFQRFLALPKLRTFVALCATNYKLSKLLSYFSTSQREILLRQFVSQLDESDNSFDDAVMVSETIANTNSEEILSAIEKNIKQQYTTCDSLNDSKCMAIYGILAGLCKDKAVYDKKWFYTMSKKYQASALATLQFKSMDNDEKIIERMYFYDDPDGRDSYMSFLSSFRSSTNWKLEEYYSYVRVTSTVGKSIEIFANKPSYEESGEQNINKIFAEGGYKPAIIIHRGHSFHTEKTLEKIPASAKLVFIGSCGGFYKASIAIKNAPDAHIIATRQIGTQHINDPIIFSINEAFRQRQDIQWPTFWEKLKLQLGNYSLFYDYVPPHKNIESLFQRAYYKTFGL